MRDRKFGAFGQDLQVGVGHDRGDLQDRIAGGIQARHFEVDPDQAAFTFHVSCHRSRGAGRDGAS
jgi:hypothetical protein